MCLKGWQTSGELLYSLLTLVTVDNIIVTVSIINHITFTFVSIRTMQCLFDLVNNNEASYIKQLKIYEYIRTFLS